MTPRSNRPKRGEDVERPGGELWRLVCNDRAAGEGWAQLCTSNASVMDQAWLAITSDPRRHDHRQHQLKGSLSHHDVNGKTLEQWQYEPTAAGRIWYCIDDDTHTVYLVFASPGHPKQTDKGKRKKR
jgi:hypothetical protein